MKLCCTHSCPVWSVSCKLVSSVLLFCICITEVKEDSVDFCNTSLASAVWGMVYHDWRRMYHSRGFSKENVEKDRYEALCTTFLALSALARDMTTRLSVRLPFTHAYPEDEANMMEFMKQQLSIVEPAMFLDDTEPPKLKLEDAHVHSAKDYVISARNFIDKYPNLSLYEAWLEGAAEEDDRRSVQYDSAVRYLQTLRDTEGNERGTYGVQGKFTQVELAELLVAPHDSDEEPAGGGA